MDVNKPVENPKLIAAIDALRQNPNTETEGVFFECLKEANFLIILHDRLVHDEPDEEGKFTLKEETKISFPMLSDADGNPLHFGFTDWPSVYAWRDEPDQQTLILPFSDLAYLILKGKADSTGFLVNASTQNFFIPRNIISQVSGIGDTYTVKKDTEVLLGEPNEYPHALVDAVKKQLKQIRDVKQAWLLLMIKDEEQSFLIILDHTGDRDDISQKVGNAAVPHLPDGKYVDIVTTEQDFGANAVQGKEPFYKRGLFG